MKTDMKERTAESCLVATELKGIDKHLLRISENMCNDFRWKSLRELVKRYVKGRQILDVGCGTGHVTLDLAEAGYEVTATDISPNLVRLTRSRLNKCGLKADVRVLDLVEIESIDKRFDTIICLDVLEHVGDDSLAIRKLSTLLVSKGRLVVSVPTLEFLYGIRDRRLGHFRRYSKRRIVEILSGSLRILEARYWNFIGIFPLALSVILREDPILESFRGSNSGFAKAINRVLTVYLETAENRIRCPLGATLLVVCEAPD
jgi:2-polyprenyl-3-methyl-5-hydroxy-6-metoxy-1,4-benzoquinol methylase